MPTTTARRSKKVATSKVVPAGLMTAGEAGTYLRMSEEWVRQAGRKGVLPTVSIGAAVRFRRADLDALIEQSVRGAVA